MPINFYINIL